MPEERDIEKTLRAWAKNRREEAGPPVELHPATRRLLQDGVSRLKRGKSSGRGFFASLLAGSPLRLALNLSAAVAVIILCTVLLPRLWRPRPDQMLAANNARKSESSDKSVTLEKQKDALREPAPQNEPALDQGKTVANPVAASSGGQLAFRPAQNQTAAVPTAPAAAMPAPARTLAEQAAVSTFADTNIRAMAKDASSLADTPVSSRKFVRQSVQTSAGFLADDLSRADILRSFRVEQTGSQVRVIDADGSVYSGNVITLDGSAASDLKMLDSQNQSFHVSGTNLTLNQLIVFDGSFVATPPVEMSAPMGAAGGRLGAAGGGGGGGGFGGGARANRPIPPTNAVAASTAVQAAAPVPATPPSSPVTLGIQGRARIGTNEIPVLASPVQP